MGHWSNSVISSLIRMGYQSEPFLHLISSDYHNYLVDWILGFVFIFMGRFGLAPQLSTRTEKGAKCPQWYRREKRHPLLIEKIHWSLLELFLFTRFQVQFPPAGRNVNCCCARSSDRCHRLCLFLPESQEETAGAKKEWCSTYVLKFYILLKQKNSLWPCKA